MIEDDVTEFTGAKYVANALVVFEVCMVLYCPRWRATVVYAVGRKLPWEYTADARQGFVNTNSTVDAGLMRIQN